MFEQEIFYSLKEAQAVIGQWRNHYNTKRPHSSLGYRPPAPLTVESRGPTSLADAVDWTYPDSVDGVGLVRDAVERLLS